MSLCKPRISQMLTLIDVRVILIKIADRLQTMESMGITNK
jgi:(p)ppGpp synthase/HD superfamily hydrolase